MALKTSPAGLFGLPPEIRANIFEGLFTVEGAGAPLGIFQTSGSTSLALLPLYTDTDAAHRELVQTFLNVSRTCRQLYDEVRGAALLYRYNTIRICTGKKRQNLDIQQRENEAITSIHFVFHPDTDPVTIESELARLLEFPNLKRLTLELAFDFFRVFHGVDAGVGLVFKNFALNAIRDLQFFSKLGDKFKMFELRLHILKYAKNDDYPIWSQRDIYGRGWHDMLSWRSSRDPEEWRAAAEKFNSEERRLWQAFDAGVIHDKTYRDLEWELKEKLLESKVLQAEKEKRTIEKADGDDEDEESTVFTFDWF